MCELFGISSKVKISCSKMLNQFFNDAPEHPDGWGLAIFDGPYVSVEKEPLSAVMSMYLKSRLDDDIDADTLIAHIRKASVGSIAYKNTHPFLLKDSTGRLWSLAHNGTVFESQILDTYKDKQKGQCDSERILLYIIDRINEAITKKGADLEPDERFRIIDDVIQKITPFNKINLLIYDGELFYVHANHPHSLHELELPDGLVFSTIPYEGENWKSIPMNTLMAFDKNKMLYKGTTHNNTYRKENDPEEWYDSVSDPFYYYI